MNVRKLVRNKNLNLELRHVVSVYMLLFVIIRGQRLDCPACSPDLLVKMFALGLPKFSCSLICEIIQIKKIYCIYIVLYIVLLHIFLSIGLLSLTKTGAKHIQLSAATVCSS